MIGFLAADLSGKPDHFLSLGLPTILAGKLGPALYHQLAQTEDLSRLPAEEQTSLHDAYVGNALRNLILEHELHRILAVLNRERIAHMPVKGATALIEPLYPSPAIRVMSDVDILVRPDRRGAAVACLKTLGYEARRERGAVLPEVEYPMTHDGVVADLHWQITRIRVAANEERIWTRARPLAGFSGFTLLPSNLDQFYIRFLHDTIQDHHLHAVRLWQAYEAALLYRRLESGDTERLCAQAAEDGLSLVLGVYLAQIHRLFPCIAHPPPALQLLLERGVAEIHRCDSLGSWPLALHFAVGRDLLLRLRAPFLGGYRRAFVQIMWRECTLAEPTDVVRRNPASRAGHFLRLCALHLAQALWRQLRQVRIRIPQKDERSSHLTWLHMHRGR